VYVIVKFLQRDSDSRDFASGVISSPRDFLRYLHHLHYLKFLMYICFINDVVFTAYFFVVEVDKRFSSFDGDPFKR
jgi:hypothetical protein